ncbi:hypothetical protein JHK82_031377 [Glycine max]|uniref:Uncharacterized protein n=1 Tax=Glycine max TaxID=3847 RepID=A0A0R0HHQ3_SOYBN|nr:hypothetical protein JHK85_032034 [Glycine max]KAG4994642.1 hypothetical protein JHK86_031469 [Glycine max]KAG5124640.1 hypothetical protein JHK82_031377 [Glycine max]KAG5146062.1 hypothetical protein JHK84_031605 [Glycine max]KAH1159506.1 hypothetical protein GYH30_031294 [Glycine max]
MKTNKIQLQLNLINIFFLIHCCPSRLNFPGSSTFEAMELHAKQPNLQPDLSFIFEALSHTTKSIKKSKPDPLHNQI